MIGTAAVEIARLGYKALWFGEGPATKEAFAHAAILLAATRRIVVATGIANIYARDPAAMNNAAHALADAYPKRFLLGMGVSHAAPVQARGHEYRQPLVRDAISLGFRVPQWLAADRQALTGKVAHRPQRSEIDVPADEKRVVEFFAKY